VADELLIGELLVRRGAVSRGAVEEASLAAHAAGERLCSRLLAAGACSEGALVGALAQRLGMPGVDLSRTVVELAVLDYVPQQVAQADSILPLSMAGDRIHVAVDSPARAEQTVSELRFVTGREVSVYVAVLGALDRAIAQSYDARARGAAIWRGSAAAAGAAHVEAVLPEPIPHGEPMLVGDADVELLEPPPLEAEAEIDITDAGEEVVATVHVETGPKRILVVDDEPAIRLLAQRALQHHGFEVDAAGDGEEALRSVRARPPDLLLLDAMLPRLHGFEVARRVRSDPATRHVPIVIMTAVYRGWRFAQDARENYGAEDYVEKPFRTDDLVRRIELVLESTAARDDTGRQAAQPVLERGKELAAAGKHAEAAEAFAEAGRLDPFSAEAQHHLGRELRAQGDAFRAMTALERAVELRPAYFAALRPLAALYLETGFRRKAAEALERAVAAAPDDAQREAARSELLRLL